MPLNSVYIERDDETEAPPERVMKVAYHKGGKVFGSEEIMEPVVFFSIGAFDERTYEDSFKTSPDQQFSVTVEDLMRALIGLGVIDTTRHINTSLEPRSAT